MKNKKECENCKYYDNLYQCTNEYFPVWGYDWNFSPTEGWHCSEWKQKDTNQIRDEGVG